MHTTSWIIIFVIFAISSGKSANLYTTSDGVASTTEESFAISEESTSYESQDVVVFEKKKFIGIQEEIKQLNSKFDNEFKILKQKMKHKLENIEKNMHRETQDLKDFMHQQFEDIKATHVLSKNVTCDEIVEEFQDLKALLLPKISNSSNYVEDSITIRPTTCAKVLSSNNSSGIYNLYESVNSSNSFLAYCLQDPQGNGGTWTVIQRRQDGSVDFYRDWQAYKNGFGNISGEYWLGLEKIHAMTQSQPHELWVQMEKFGGEKRYAKYEKFAIGNSDSKYALSVSGFSGNAVDGFGEYHNGMKFSTMDNDNEGCAKIYNGAWWFSRCYQSHLNGKYHKTGKGPQNQGIHWKDSGTSETSSLTYVHMAIRPVT